MSKTYLLKDNVKVMEYINNNLYSNFIIVCSGDTAKEYSRTKKKLTYIKHKSHHVMKLSKIIAEYIENDESIIITPYIFNNITVDIFELTHEHNYILITDGVKYTKNKYSGIGSYDHDAIINDRITIDSITHKVSFKDVKAHGHFEKEINMSQHNSFFYENGQYYNYSFPMDMFSVFSNIYIIAEKDKDVKLLNSLINISEVSAEFLEN